MRFLTDGRRLPVWYGNLGTGADGSRFLLPLDSGISTAEGLVTAIDCSRVGNISRCVT